MKTWVYVDHFKGEVVSASWEAISVGKTFGAVTALVFGSGVDALVQAAFEFGANEVLQSDDAALADFRAEVYASTLTALAFASAPDLILLPTTFRAKEMAAMCAIDLKTGVIVDVTALEVDGDKLIATRPIYEGKLFEKTVCATKPQFITLRGRAFLPLTREPERGHGTLTKVAAKADALTVIEGYATGGGGVNLGNAGVIVSGGRGVSNNPSLGLDEKETAKKVSDWLVN